MHFATRPWLCCGHNWHKEEEPTRFPVSWLPHGSCSMDGMGGKKSRGKISLHPTAAVSWECGGDAEYWGVQTLGCLVGSGRYLGHKGITEVQEEPVEISHPWGSPQASQVQPTGLELEHVPGFISPAKGPSPKSPF